LDISASGDDVNLLLVWAEDGGPPVHGVPQMGGFGSRMISRSIAQQFGGELSDADGAGAEDLVAEDELLDVGQPGPDRLGGGCGAARQRRALR